jgi:hypothetical protein
VVGEACRSSSSLFPYDANEHNENQNDRDSRQYFPNEHLKNIRVFIQFLGTKFALVPLSTRKELGDVARPATKQPELDIGLPGSESVSEEPADARRCLAW